MAKDLFSQHAGEYAKFRPGYPRSWGLNSLISFVDSREQAWDAGTGNGQAAVELARHFKKGDSNRPEQGNKSAGHLNSPT